MSSRAEKQRALYERMLLFERQAWLEGFVCLTGLDEAGRGPLAGPVAAAACILDPDRPVYGLNDSKKLSAAVRDTLYDQIRTHALDWSVSLVDAATIDRINILEATCQAMRQAVAGLKRQPDLLLVDAVKLGGLPMAVRPIVRGDAQSVSIAAASILAKVTRDRLMLAYDRQYPAYGFASHKGYGTRAHYDALLSHGPCPLHRLSFLKNLDTHRRPDDPNA